MKTFMTQLMLLLLATSAFATGNVKIYGNLEFSDASVQQKAATIPTCSSGEVYINVAGAMVCGKIIPINHSFFRLGPCSVL
jgi:TRAP-type uncharacterized transport system substrate-binding protein